MTNLEWVRNTSEEDLAMLLMCPYDTIENVKSNELPCQKNKDESKQFCFNCLKGWLRKEQNK